MLLTGIASLLGFAGGGAAWVLVHLIEVLTNVALFHELASGGRSLAALEPGWPLFVAAVMGALLISLLAKWAPLIRGHGIPEAMEAVLTKQSRVAPRTAIAKPISAAIAIGTGAPFGAEGPIIVTGGSLGSLLGQVIPVTPSERKILLAAGAAAGMSAICEAQCEGVDADRAQLPRDAGLTGGSLQSGSIIATDRPERDPRFDLDVDTPQSGTPGPMLVVPLRVRDRVLGVARVFFDAESTAPAPLGELLAAPLSAAARNVLLYRSLLESVEDVARARREVEDTRSR